MENYTVDGVEQILESELKQKPLYRNKLTTRAPCVSRAQRMGMDDVKELDGQDLDPAVPHRQMI